MFDRPSLKTDPEALAPPVLALAILIGSSAAILIRWSHAPTVIQVFYRLLFTTLAVAPIALLRHREAFHTVSRRDIAVTAVTGLVLAAHFLLFFKGVDLTTVAAATTLGQLHVAIVPIGAYLLLNERVTTRMVVGLAVAFGGILVLSTGGLFLDAVLGGAAPLVGNALALLSAVGFALYTLAGRSVRQRLPIFPYVTVVYGMATLAVGAVAVGAGTPIVHAYPLREWLLFLALAAGPGLITHTGLNWALEHIDASVGSASFLGIPVASTILAALALGEIPSLVTLAGGVVALGGVALVTMSSPNC